MALTGDALLQVTNAQRINYELLGNPESELHAHIIPLFAEEPEISFGRMARRFVNGDHDTPMLLPPDLRDWVPADHIVHFIIDAVGLLDLSTDRINTRGTGSVQ